MCTLVTGHFALDRISQPRVVMLPCRRQLEKQCVSLALSPPNRPGEPPSEHVGAMCRAEASAQINLGI